jgi:hypothetical protein
MKLTLAIIVILLASLTVAAQSGLERQAAQESRFANQIQPATWRMLMMHDCSDKECPARRLVPYIVTVHVNAVAIHHELKATFAKDTMWTANPIMYVQSGDDWTLEDGIVVSIHEGLHRLRDKKGKPVCGDDSRAKPRYKVCYLWGDWANSSQEITDAVERHFAKDIKRVRVYMSFAVVMPKELGRNYVAE